MARVRPVGPELQRSFAEAGRFYPPPLPTILAALLQAINGPGESAPPVHSQDFTYVRWSGVEYTFALGVQSDAVRVLWEEWEKTGLGLHQQTIRERIDAERDNFEIPKTFRGHPAFGTMIVSGGDGRYRLNPPAPSA